MTAAGLQPSLSGSFCYNEVLHADSTLHRNSTATEKNHAPIVYERICFTYWRAGKTFLHNVGPATEHIGAIQPRKPPRPTQLPILCGTENEYRLRGSGSAVWLGRYQYRIGLASH